MRSIRIRVNHCNSQTIQIGLRERTQLTELLLPGKKEMERRTRAEQGTGANNLVLSKAR